MQLRSINISDKKAEIQRAGEDDEETEDDFFEIHGNVLFCELASLSVGSVVLTAFRRDHLVNDALDT
jgi:hypothetical protein